MYEVPVTAHPYLWSIGMEVDRGGVGLRPERDYSEYGETKNFRGSSWRNTSAAWLKPKGRPIGLPFGLTPEYGTTMQTSWTGPPPEEGFGQAARPISTARLHRSPGFHLRPINLVIS